MKQIFQTHLRHGVLAIVLLSFISLSHLSTSASPHKQHVTAVQRTEAPVLFTNIDILLSVTPIAFETSTNLFASVFAHVQKVVIARVVVSPQNYPDGRVLKHYDVVYVKPINNNQLLNYNQANKQNYKAYTYFKHKSLAPLNRQLKPSLEKLQSYSC